MGNLSARLAKLQAAIADRGVGEPIWREIKGNETREAALDRLVAEGAITELERGRVRFIRNVVVQQAKDGSWLHPFTGEVLVKAPETPVEVRRSYHVLDNAPSAEPVAPVPAEPKKPRILGLP